jgi:competence protein ComEC
MSEYIKTNRHKLVVFSLLFLSIFVWSSVFRLPDDNLHIKVLDVGQGDSVLIRTPAGYKILVDGGPSDKVLDYLGEELPFYDKTLDLVVLTHPQSDHLTGLIEVAKRYNIKNLWVNYTENTTPEYEEWENSLNEKGLQETIVWSGDRLVFSDEVVLEVIWPRGELASDDLNTASIVIMLDYRDFEGILTGDADSQVQPFTSSSSELEFLKVPHHGSKEALDETYLNELSPEISVISVSSRNKYGHPHNNLLDQLYNNESQVYRTDQNGMVEIVTNGVNWYTKTER